MLKLLSSDPKTVYYLVSDVIVVLACGAWTVVAIINTMRIITRQQVQQQQQP